MTYQSQLRRHLAEYRLSELRVDGCGTFRYRGRDIPCEHALPVAHAWLNILPAALKPTREFLSRNPSKRHRYFHHLNSSQAFAFNLFFPYFEGGAKAATTLLAALGQDGRLEGWEPEAVPVPDEGTNLDATWATTDGVRTFCEVKLSEGELGKASDDPRHRQKLETLYAPVLRGRVADELLEPKSFFAAYQFLRNVWHLLREPSGSLVFLVPKANTKVWGSLAKLIAGVRQPYQSRIRRVAVEDVLGRLASDREEHGLREHGQTLARKYLVAGSE